MRTTLSALACLLAACSTLSDSGAAPGSETLPESTGPEDPTSAGGTTGPAATTGVDSESTADPGDASSTGALSGPTTGAPVGPCGEPPPFTGAMPQSIEAAGMQRSYLLAIPEGYDPNLSYPVVFAWHGRGGTAELARLYFQVEEASAGAAIFVYPQGLPLPDMDNQTGWDLAPDAEDVALFDAILADLEARLCVDAGRVFSTGHSFGGYMSNALGCYRGDALRAIAPVAGGGPFGACEGQVAAWVAHGTGDTVVPFAQGEGSRDHWTGANHCEDSSAAVDPAPCVAYAGCDAGAAVHWCEHSEAALGGHGWPAWAGPAIWAFFAGQ